MMLLKKDGKWVDTYGDQWDYADSANQEIDNLKAQIAKLEKLNSAALERLSYHACPSDRNNYGQPCNDSDDCVACWREYLGGKDV